LEEFKREEYSDHAQNDKVEGDLGIVLLGTVTALPKLAIIATLNGTMTEPKLVSDVITPKATP
jgi:hypothetical protein